MLECKTASKNESEIEPGKVTSEEEPSTPSNKKVGSLSSTQSSDDFVCFVPTGDVSPHERVGHGDNDLL
jgi:hypothetical protein